MAPPTDIDMCCYTSSVGSSPEHAALDGPRIAAARRRERPPEMPVSAPPKRRPRFGLCYRFPRRTAGGREGKRRDGRASGIVEGPGDAEEEGTALPRFPLINVRLRLLREPGRGVRTHPVDEGK